MPEEGDSDPGRPRLPARLRLTMSIGNASAVYLFVLFALWEPATFLTVQNWQVLLDNQAISGLVAIGLIAPLSAGVIDVPASRR
jgi:ribose transport system permease protein